MRQRHAEPYASGRFATQAEVKRIFQSYPDFPRNKYGEVTAQRVTDILIRPLYTGHICSERYGINWLKAQHEGLIALETFDKAQARRKGASPVLRNAPILARNSSSAVWFAMRAVACRYGPLSPGAIVADITIISVRQRLAMTTASPSSGIRSKERSAT